MALRGIDDTCFIGCEVWDESDRKMRHLALRDADGFGPPCSDVLTAMAENPNFKRINNIVSQDRNMYFFFRGWEDSGGGGHMKMMRKLFVVSILHRHTQ